MANSARKPKQNNSSVSVPCVVLTKDKYPVLVQKLSDLPAGDTIASVVLNNYGNKKGSRPNWPEVNFRSRNMAEYYEPVFAAKIVEVGELSFVLDTGEEVRTTKNMFDRHRPVVGAYFVKRGAGRHIFYSVVSAARFKQRFKKGGPEEAPVEAETNSDKMFELALVGLKHTVSENCGLNVKSIMDIAATVPIQMGTPGKLKMSFKAGEFLQSRLGPAYEPYVTTLLQSAKMSKMVTQGAEPSLQEMEKAEPEQPTDKEENAALRKEAIRILVDEVIPSAIRSDLMLSDVAKDVLANREAKIGDAVFNLGIWYIGLSEDARLSIASAARHELASV